MKIAQPEPRRRSALLSRAVTPTSSAGVPRNGGTIKFKVGITAPVEITDPSTAHLTLPAIVDRNFSFAPDMTHNVWIESKRPLPLHPHPVRHVGDRKSTRLNSS